MRVPPVLLAASTLFAFGFLVSADEKPPEPAYSGRLSLVRYDLPRGLSDGYAPTRQLAQRRNDEGIAVDWPDFTLNGKPLFKDGAEEAVSLRLRRGADAASPFRVDQDYLIQPGNHWFRPIEWRGGRRHVYTADKAARTANASDSATGRYELWTFPVRIKTDGPPAVKNVILKYEGHVVYKRPGPWRSLTLLLPATEPGHQYELSVDGRAVVRFDLGLMPVKLGTPREQLYQVNTTLPGEPKISVATLGRPDEFPHLREWQADVAALGKPTPPAKSNTDNAPQGIARWLGNRVSRSGVTMYAMALPHGMSGGFSGQGQRKFAGSPDEYAELLSRMNFDAVFDPVSSVPAPSDPASIETRADALAKQGVKLGLQYDNNWTRPSLQHPNLAFFSHNLPEWHAPLYRSLSLAAQRFSRLSNFAGLSIGADNAGFASYWNWAPPVPDRPWGEAMVDFMGTAHPRIPRAPQLGPVESGFEVPVKTTADFIRYASRYESTFQQYGYFAEAVKEVDPQLVFTSGSFGSSPGAGGRGGWPWASIPGRVIFENMPVQQAYDWNDTRAAKPMHLVALIDRLRSYQPRKRTWALLNNFQLLYGREAFQRAVALAFTRGIDGLGTNFLPHPSGEGGRSDAIDYVAEMNDWGRKFGGVIARSEPVATIGVFYGQHQAIQRAVLTGENPPDEKLYDGSHEGKVTEALFMCHAAGWPARVITYQELMRGPLPTSMKAILLVGLDVADSSWTWSPELEKGLTEFTSRGGIIIADSTSVSPVASEQTPMRIASYVSQTQLDPTPLLLRRNQENIAILRKSMERVSPPIASSEREDVWAIPTQCGDVQYVTVVNQGTAQGDEAGEYLRPVDPRATKPEVWKTKANASLYVRPQVAELQWNTERPIYDLRSGVKGSPAEFRQVDLTKDAFQVFAIPPREINGLDLLVQTETRPGRNAFYEALVTTTKPQPMRGVPIRIEITDGKQRAEIFAATGWPVRLPLSLSDRGAWRITATELLSNVSATTSVNVPGPIDNLEPPSARITDARALDRFANRKHVALRICLTPEQEKDATVKQLAESLVNFYRERGRVATVGRVMPEGIVESLQPLRTPLRYPQWKTIPADLVLFGNSQSNVLILDQARACIFPQEVNPAGEKIPALAYARSPFVGEYDVVNVIASDSDGLAAGVKALIGGTREELRLAQ